jgi:hypothetical protein
MLSFENSEVNQRKKCLNQTVLVLRAACLSIMAEREIAGISKTG